MVEIIGNYELSRRWRISERSIRRFVADGVLTAVRNRGRVAYRLEDVHAFEGGPMLTDGDLDRREPLMTPAEVARLCPYAESTIKAFARTGELPCRRVGQAFRFAPGEVEIWLESWLPTGRSK